MHIWYKCPCIVSFLRDTKRVSQGDKPRVGFPTEGILWCASTESLLRPLLWGRRLAASIAANKWDYFIIIIGILNVFLFITITPERNLPGLYWFTDALLFLLSVLQIMFRVNSLNLDNLLILQNCILLFVYVWRQKT